MSQPQMHFALALHLFAFTDGLSDSVSHCLLAPLQLMVKVTVEY